MQSLGLRVEGLGLSLAGLGFKNGSGNGLGRRVFFKPMRA